MGAKYLNERKSEALAHYLKGLIHFDLRIESKDNIHPEQLNELMHYDLVVDATGDETFSTLLAYHTNRLRVEVNSLSPVILHTWVDAGGLAARSLIDDGQGVCYRCLKIKDNNGM